MTRVAMYKSSGDLKQAYQKETATIIDTGTSIVLLDRDNFDFIWGELNEMT